MPQFKFFTIVLSLITLSFSQSLRISGFIKEDGTQQAVTGAVVRLAVTNITDTTDTAGAFLPEKIATGTGSQISTGPDHLQPDFSANGAPVLTVLRKTRVSLGVYTLQGRSVYKRTEVLDIGTNSFGNMPLSKGNYIYRIRIGKEEYTLKSLQYQSKPFSSYKSTPEAAVSSFRRLLADTLVISKAGYLEMKCPVSADTLDTTLLISKEIIGPSITMQPQSAALDPGKECHLQCCGSRYETVDVPVAEERTGYQRRS